MRLGDSRLAPGLGGVWNRLHYYRRIGPAIGTLNARSPDRADPLDGTRSRHSTLPMPRPPARRSQSYRRRLLVSVRIWRSSRLTSGGLLKWA
jgi:hypothetical protein